MSETKEDKPIQSKMGLVPYIASMITGIVGAIIAAQATVTQRFKKDLRSVPFMEKFHKKYFDDLTSYSEDFFNSREMDAKKWSVTTGTRKEAYKKAIDEMLDEREFPSFRHGMKESFPKGIKESVDGFFMRYEMMSPDAKRAIRFNSAITAAVAFGGLMTFFNNMHTHKQVERLLEEKEADSSLER